VLNEVTRPENVLGVTLIGSTVAFPHPDIHHFLMWGIVRESEDEQQDTFYSEISPEPSEPQLSLSSAVSEEVGRAVFDRVDRSAGVRASVVRASVLGEKQPRNVLMRDGTQRILPYVLLIDPDPTHLLAASDLEGRTPG
jgi:hypothetical protein